MPLYDKLETYRTIAIKASAERAKIAGNAFDNWKHQKQFLDLKTNGGELIKQAHILLNENKDNELVSMKALSEGNSLIQQAHEMWQKDFPNL